MNCLRTFVSTPLGRADLLFLLMQPLLKIFGTPQGIVLGVIHFPQLNSNNPTVPFGTALENALLDLQSFEDGGVHGVIIENNYDEPHTIHVTPDVRKMMTQLGMRIREATKLPLGVCVLWNDYESSFAIAKAIGAQFIRVPVFVDEVETAFGIVKGDPLAVLKSRKTLGAEDVHIIVDLHVKHARLLSQSTLSEAAHAAIGHGADGVILTGQWTGDPPSFQDLSTVRNTCPEALIFAGSGVSEKNVSEICKHANGVIVSTSLKTGENIPGERNVKTWRQRIDLQRVQSLMKHLNSHSPPPHA